MSNQPNEKPRPDATGFLVRFATAAAGGQRSLAAQDEVGLHAPSKETRVSTRGYPSGREPVLVAPVRSSADLDCFVNQ